MSSRTYNTWKGMHQRCRDKNRESWKWYGARGIKVCRRWRDFRSFLADMGEAPIGKTLDRINNNKGYSKSNCRWATPLEQTRNSRMTKNITFDGRTQTIGEWNKELGLSPSGIANRLAQGWPFEKAMTTKSKGPGRPRKM